MTQRSFSFLIISTVAACRILHADEDPKAILAKAFDTYQSLKSYDFEGKSVTETTIAGKTTRTEVDFVVAYHAPDKLRLELRYPTAGNWLRVSDGEFMLVSRSLTKESRRAPITDRSIETLNSSPVYSLQRIGESAENPVLEKSETIEAGGRHLDCHVIQFAVHRQELRPGESSGKSTVWVDKKSGLIVRQEIRTSATSGNEVSEGKRIVMVDNFQLNGDLAEETFSTKPHHGQAASNRK